MRQSENQPKRGKLKAFFKDVLRGAAIGVAFIIPGFSGGSVAVLLGVYERLVDNLSALLKHFCCSFVALLPILLGAALGACAMLFPIRYGLEAFPIPTVTLFVGLAIGGVPAVLEKIKGKPNLGHVAAFLVPCALAALLALLPASASVGNLALSAPDYLLLFGVCALAACALVVPGISGSMVLLVFGYYDFLVRMLTQVAAGRISAECVLVLLVAALGIAFGVVAASYLMKKLLARFPKGTYCAILGFLAGSIVAVYAPFAEEVSMAPAWHFALAALLLAFGVFLALGMRRLAKKRA